MLLNELIQRVQSLYSKGVQSDDSRLTARHIYSKIKSVRSKLLTQRLNKRQKISQWNYQTIECIELIETTIHECQCIPYPGCKVYRTKYELPKPMTDLNRHVIKSVTSIDGIIDFSETSWEAFKYKKGSKYTGFKPDYFIKNNYLYIIGKNIPKVITVTGLFEDPTETLNFPSYCGNNTEENCISPLDMEYPFDEKDVDALVELAAKELIGRFQQAKEDLTNDTKDNIIEESK